MKMKVENLGTGIQHGACNWHKFTYFAPRYYRIELANFPSKNVGASISSNEPYESMLI